MRSEKRCYKSNMEALKEHHYSLWDRIRTIEEPWAVEIFSSSQGKPNMKVTKEDGTVCYLHDREDPEKEVPLFLEMVPERANGVVLLTGMGLGYTPKAILEQRKNIQYLAVFDLSPDLFSKALHHVDLTAMLSDPRLILSMGPDQNIGEDLAPANLSLQLENIHNLKHVPSFSLDEKKYTKLSEKVFTYANQHNLGGGAILGGGKTYSNNRFFNLPSMYKNNILEDLKDKFKNIPAVLVAGGPSLDKNIHLLPRLKNRALLIAVDSALPVLTAHGVSPDFMTAIDPYDLIYEKFADALPEMDGTCLIASAWVAPKIPKIFAPEKVFWTFSGRNMENWLMGMLGGNIPTGGASTVAHLNLVAAILMGCSPIIFIGQDLSYSGNGSHAANTSLTQNQAVEKLLSSKDRLLTEGIHGEQVPTDRKFLNFKLHFEHLINMHPGNYINSTAQGAKIEGTVAMGLEEVIETHCKDEVNIDQIIRSMESNSRTADVFIEAFKRFIEKSKILFRQIDKADQLQRKVRNSLKSKQGKRKKYKGFNDLNHAQQKQVNAIDKIHKTIDGYSEIWSIMDEVTMTGLQKSERKKHEICQLEGKPGKYTEWLVKNIERLDHINRVRKDELQYFVGKLSELVSYYENEIEKVTLSLQGKMENQISLADFYFESNEFSLLEQVCSNIGGENEISGQILFYEGCLALLKNRFETALIKFEAAEQHDQKLKEKIKDFRIRVGDRYIDHAKFFSGKDENTVRRMLIKGLKYGGAEHPLLNKRINEMADADLKKLTTLFESGDVKGTVGLAKKWIDDLDKNYVLADALSKTTSCEFYKIYAGLMVKDCKYDKAVENYDKLLFHIDDNPEYYLLKADACFAMNDFDNGVTALNQAVSLDKNYAQYWENMGDNLANKGDFNDALAAYEQNLMAVPENKMILTKIAKCYLELGQVDAATEAMNQLKKNP